MGIFVCSPTSLSIFSFHRCISRFWTSSFSLRSASFSVSRSASFFCSSAISSSVAASVAPPFFWFPPPVWRRDHCTNSSKVASVYLYPWLSKKIWSFERTLPTQKRRSSRDHSEMRPASWYQPGGGHHSNFSRKTVRSFCREEDLVWFQKR